MIKIHPSAIVSSKSEIGENVSIGPFAIIEDDVKIGNDSEIGPNVYCANGTRIGERTKIHSGTVIATLPQDLKFGGEVTTFEIGNDTVVREFCTLNRGTKEHWKSTVGNNCLLMAYVHVAHDCEVGNNVIIANGTQLGGHTKIEDWVIIGGLVGVHQFSKVGAHSMIGSNSKIAKDIPPFILADGNPINYGKINLLGLRRRGFTNDAIEIISSVYRILYKSNLNVTQAVKLIEEKYSGSVDAEKIISFIKSSQRGIVGSRFNKN